MQFSVRLPYLKVRGVGGATSCEKCANPQHHTTTSMTLKRKHDHNCTHLHHSEEQTHVLHVTQPQDQQKHAPCEENPLPLPALGLVDRAEGHRIGLRLRHVAVEHHPLQEIPYMPQPRLRRRTICIEAPGIAQKVPEEPKPIMRFNVRPGRGKRLRVVGLDPNLQRAVGRGGCRGLEERQVVGEAQDL